MPLRKNQTILKFSPKEEPTVIKFSPKELNQVVKELNHFLNF